MGNKYFLHFDCPLRFTEFDDSKGLSDSQLNLEYKCGAVSMSGDFIIERNHERQDLGISRPQNPEQNSDRLTFISTNVSDLLYLGERVLMRAIWGDTNSMSMRFFIAYGLYSYMQQELVERTIKAFVHRAWMATYQPDWNANGPWKWFWRLSNWEPPIPFRTLSKYLCSLEFFLYFGFEYWFGVAHVTLRWLLLFPKEELIGIYVSAVLTKSILWFY